MQLLQSGSYVIAGSECQAGEKQIVQLVGLLHVNFNIAKSTGRFVVTAYVEVLLGIGLQFPEQFNQMVYLGESDT